MPTLREYQRAMGRYLLGDAVEADVEIISDAPRLAIYRNTCRSTLTRALALNFPAVRRVVGEDFFEAAAASFISAHPPVSAYLNDYGEPLADFLSAWPPAAGLVYLADLARLEWAVSRALHAAERARLRGARLESLALAAADARTAAQLAFVRHPSVGTLRLRYPVDAIWRAVLERDEAAMTAVDLAAGPVHLLIERDTDQALHVHRLRPIPWHLIDQLCAGTPLQAALDAALQAQCASAGESAIEPDPTGAAELESALGEHLARGRFVDFEFCDKPIGAQSA